MKPCHQLTLLDHPASHNLSMKIWQIWHLFCNLYNNICIWLQNLWVGDMQVNSRRGELKRLALAVWCRFSFFFLLIFMQIKAVRRRLPLSCLKLLTGLWLVDRQQPVGVEMVVHPTFWFRVKYQQFLFSDSLIFLIESKLISSCSLV